jgi:predicted lipoprotein with Yx(FWY)xxD motif
VKNFRTLSTLATAAAVGVLTLAGCGSSSGSAATGADSSGTSGTTVTVQDAAGGRVLAAPDGRTLYVSDQEKGKVLCVSSACESIWSPLTVPSGTAIKAPQGLAGQLSTIKRSDGSSQVALDGRPLYTFSLDHSSGQANGNGATDSFDGVDFSWHSATPAGSAPAPSKSATSGGGRYGGYGY